MVRTVGTSSFEITSPRPEASYQWIFPEGVTLEGVQVEKDFDQPGEYPVQLVARENGTKSETETSVIVHEAGQPQAVPRVFINGKRVWGDFFLVSPTDRVTFGSYSVGMSGTRSTALETWWKQGRPVSVDSLPHLLRVAGPHRMKLVVKDLADETFVSEKEITIVVEDRKPEILDINVNVDPLEGYKKVGVSVLARDVDGEISDYRYELIEDGRVVDVQMLKEAFAVFDLTSRPGAHQYSFRVTVTDSGKNNVRFHSPEVFSVTGALLQNTAPGLNLEASPANVIKPGSEIQFYARTEDVDGDALTYQWFIQDGESSEFPIGERTVHRFFNPGTFLVRAEISDGMEKVSQTIEVHVIAEREILADESDDKASGEAGLLGGISRRPIMKDPLAVGSTSSGGVDASVRRSSLGGVQRQSSLDAALGERGRKTTADIDYEIEFLIEEMQKVTSLGERRRILSEIKALRILLEVAE